MYCKVGALDTLAPYKFVVVLSVYEGKILLSRHRARTTWETQGGHIELGETPEEAARRELFEESGALEYKITPLCDYEAGDEAGSAAGVVFCACITRLGPLPESEMEETRCFDALPGNLSYPGITPHLFRRAAELGSLSGAAI